MSKTAWACSKSINKSFQIKLKKWRKRYKSSMKRSRQHMEQKIFKSTHIIFTLSAFMMEMHKAVIIIPSFTTDSRKSGESLTILESQMQMRRTWSESLKVDNHGKLPTGLPMFKRASPRFWKPMISTSTMFQLTHLFSRVLIITSTAKKFHKRLTSLSKKRTKLWQRRSMTNTIRTRSVLWRRYTTKFTATTRRNSIQMPNRTNSGALHSIYGQRKS